MRRLIHLSLWHAWVVVAVATLCAAHPANAQVAGHDAEADARAALIKAQQAAIRARLQARQALLLGQPAPSVDSIVDTCVAQCSPFWLVELRRMRAICETSAQDYARVLAESRANIRATASAFADEQQRQHATSRSVTGQFANPRTIVLHAVEQAVRKHLSPDQSRRYEREITARDQYRKEAIIVNLLVMYDDTLKLSAKQCAEIRESLERNWDEQWFAAIDGINPGNQYIPFIHLNCLYPHIDDRQRTAWREQYARVGLLWQGLGFIQGVEFVSADAF
jgi:hypothetical protein